MLQITVGNRDGTLYRKLISIRHPHAFKIDPQNGLDSGRI